MTVRGWTTGTAAAIGKIGTGPAIAKQQRARARARVRRKTVADLPCRHRGEPIDQGDCPACNGTVTVAIYECRLHARCTLDRAFPGAKVCAGCGDRRPQALTVSDRGDGGAGGA